MIVAYCDRCTNVIPAEVAAGVRYVFGKAELSGHLCPLCMAELRASVEAFHQNYSLRVVR